MTVLDWHDGPSGGYTGDIRRDGNAEYPHLAGIERRGGRHHDDLYRAQLATGAEDWIGKAKMD